MSASGLEAVEHNRLRWHLAVARFELILVELELQERKANFNPKQPRVPGGNPNGGQWTSGGTSQTQVTIDPSALTGISTIDDATKDLTDILANVMDIVEYVPGLSPQMYGTLVHQAFATAVRLQGLPGVGFWDVETTFSLGSIARYGLKDSIRTDVVLRNDVGDIIAIYDVKTGESGLSMSRVEELRAKTRAMPDTPVIQLHILRGPSLKHWRILDDVRTDPMWPSAQLCVTGI